MKRKPKKQEPSATLILEYVLTKKDVFPWPHDYDHEPLFNVTEESGFRYEDFVSVTKAWFARYNGVAGGQVTRWVIAGMPVREDGRLNLWRVNRWLDDYREEDPDKRNPRH